VITHGPGMTAVTWVAALVTISGLMVALVSVRLDSVRRVESRTSAVCASA